MGLEETDNRNETRALSGPVDCLCLTTVNCLYLHLLMAFRLVCHCARCLHRMMD